MFIKQISNLRPRQESLCQTGFGRKTISDSLGSISAVVTNKEDRNTLTETYLLIPMMRTVQSLKQTMKSMNVLSVDWSLKEKPSLISTGEWLSTGGKK